MNGLLARKLWLVHGVTISTLSSGHLDDTAGQVWRHVFLLLFLHIAVHDYCSVIGVQTAEQLHGLENDTRASINVAVASKWVEFQILSELSL